MIRLIIFLFFFFTKFFNENVLREIHLVCFGFVARLVTAVRNNIGRKPISAARHGRSTFGFTVPGRNTGYIYYIIEYRRIYYLFIYP